MRKNVIFIVTILAFFSSLHGEVEYVKLKWNTIICQSACMQQLIPKLSSIPGVANVSFDKNFGEAELRWKPEVPFSLNAVSLAMRTYGLSILAMNIKVTGTVAHDSRNVYLISRGDNERYLLLGPIQYQKNNYVMDYSTAAHALDPITRQKLLDAEKNHELIIVEGSMFEIERHELKIIARTISFPDEVKKP